MDLFAHGNVREWAPHKTRCVLLLSLASGADVITVTSSHERYRASRTTRCAPIRATAQRGDDLAPDHLPAACVPCPARRSGQPIPDGVLAGVWHEVSYNDSPYAREVYCV